MRQIIRLPGKRNRKTVEQSPSLPEGGEDAELRVVDESPSLPPPRLEAIAEKNLQTGEEVEPGRRRLVIRPKRSLLRKHQPKDEPEAPVRGEDPELAEQPEQLEEEKKSVFVQSAKALFGTAGERDGEASGDGEMESEKSFKSGFFQRGIFARIPRKKKLVKKTEPKVLVEVEESPDEEPLGEDGEVVKLEPSMHRAEIRSHQPHVADLLSHVEELESAEDGWGEWRRTPPVGWFFLLCLAIFGAAGWAVYDVFRVQPELEEISSEKKSMVEEKRREDQEVKQSLKRMEECARKYLSAESISEILPYVRFPERVEPLMRDYYSRMGRRKTRFHYFDEIRPIPYGSRSFVHVKVVLKDGADYHLFMEELEDGSFRVDWENDVYYQPMPWREYVQKRPLKPTDMRVRVAPDHFYGFAFRDHEKYQCYRLTALGSDRFLFGYVERGSALAKRMEAYMIEDRLMEDPDALLDGEEAVEGDAGGEESSLAEREVDPMQWRHRLKLDRAPPEQAKGKAMILRLRFLREDESTQCVRIEEILSDQWAYYDEPGALPE